MPILHSIKTPIFAIILGTTAFSLPATVMAENAQPQAQTAIIELVSQQADGKSGYHGKRHKGSFGHTGRRDHIMRMICSEKSEKKLKHIAAYVADELELKASQQTAFDDIQQTLLQLRDSLQKDCENKGEVPTTEYGRAYDMMQLLENRMAFGLKAIETLKPKVKTFYEELDTEQREKLDKMIPHGRHRG